MNTLSQARRDHLAGLVLLATLTKPDLLTNFTLLSTFQPENIAFDLYGSPTSEGPELEAICLQGTTRNLYEALDPRLIKAAEAHVEREWLAAKKEDRDNAAIAAYESHVEHQYDIGVEV